MSSVVVNDLTAAAAAAAAADYLLVRNTFSFQAVVVSSFHSSFSPLNNCYSTESRHPRLYEIGDLQTQERAAEILLPLLKEFQRLQMTCYLTAAAYKPSLRKIPCTLRLHRQRKQLQQVIWRPVYYKRGHFYNPGTQKHTR